MKVIDLLNKLANKEEVPTKIAIDGIIYELNEVLNYRNDNGNNWLDLFDGEDLNEEIKVIEEDKKIPEKIDQNDREWHYLHNTKKTTEEVADNLEHLRQKVNKIIDYLEENK